VPHIVRSQDLRPINLRSVDTGVGQAIELRHIAVEGPGANTPPQVQPVTTNSSIGKVPGTSASGAASAAMAQMKAAAEGNPAAAPVPQTNLGLPSETPPRPPIGTPPAAQPPPAPGSKVSFLMNSPGPVPVNSTFQVPIVISGAADIASIPLQLQYDATRLSLVNVDSGDFLSRDGQAVSLAHRDDGPGTITINASRPPGTPGINGAGVVCLLTFQANAAGDSKITITRSGATTSKQQPVLAQGTDLTVSVK
jgi:general secretion pathway protein D